MERGCRIAEIEGAHLCDRHPQINGAQVIAARGRLALVACSSAATADPRFEGRVQVYQLPALD